MWNGPIRLNASRKRITGQITQFMRAGGFFFVVVAVRGDVRVRWLKRTKGLVTMLKKGESMGEATEYVMPMYDEFYTIVKRTSSIRALLI